MTTEKPNYPYTHAAAMFDHYDRLLLITTSKKEKEVLQQGWNVWMKELQLHKNLKQN